jgi:hypothetical protein
MENRPPLWFWVVSSLGLVWNGLGVAAFVHELAFLDLAGLPEVQRAFYEGRPLWATIGYAVAVFGGALGCISLLLRREWAVTMLVLCLVGIVVQIFHAIALGDAIAVFGPQGLALPASVFLIALLLTGFSIHARRRGWIS